MSIEDVIGEKVEAAVIKALAKHLEPKERRDVLTLSQLADEWLFINPSGNRLVEFNPAWWSALEKAGIKDFHFHDLRHTFATYFVEGASEYSAQYALGHSKIATTARYAHVQDDLLKAGLEALHRRLRPNPDTILTPTNEIM